MTNQSSAPLHDLLARISPFDLLDAAQRHRLVEQARCVRLARGEILHQPESAAGTMYVVLDGEVKRVLLSASGAEMVIGRAGSGDCFGEDAALLGRASLASAQALRDSRLLQIGGAALQQAMAICPAFAAALSTRLAACMYDLVENLQVCFQRNSVQRVAHYLARLAPASAERCEIRLDTDKQTIAAQLNLTPETLSRVLSRLTRDGMIRPQGRRGMVLDKLSQLRSCAAG